MVLKSTIALDKNPFLADIDEISFYLFSSLSQRLETLKRLFSGSNSQLVLVVGEAGSGKTLLLKQVLALSESYWKSCRINAHDPMHEASEAELSEMKQHRAFLHQKGDALPAIMMDDAHTLSSAELLFLIRMTGVKGYARQLDKLILFGEPSILKVISLVSDEIPEKGSIEKIHMAALSREETGEYLRRRMQAAGYEGPSLFSVSEVETLHDLSGGWPGPLNQEADKLLKKKMTEKSKIPSLFRKMLSL